MAHIPLHVQYFAIYTNEILRLFFKNLIMPTGHRTTAKKTVISPNLLVWKFCGKAQFAHSFGLFAQNYGETVPFRKVSTPGNQVKLQYFLQWT